MKSPNKATERAAGLIRKVASELILFADRMTLYGWGYASWSAFDGAWLRFRRLPKKLGMSIKGRRRPVLRDGVLFIGYAEGALGLGQAFRSDLDAAQSGGLKFGIFPLRSGIQTRRSGVHMPERYELRGAYDFNLIEVAADQIPEVFRIVPGKMFSDSYNVLRTYWELPKAPQEWRPLLKGIHEIWAPNEFVANAFSGIFDGPIVTIPPAVEDVARLGEPHDADFNRDYFGMEANRFYFMFSFDYYSSPFRKNPIGALQAFRAAFPNGTENVGLILKSTGAPDHFPEIKAEVAAAVAADPRIQVMDRTMARVEVLGLIRSSDAYLSLHRAEGFGLGMVEAMMFEKIVIGTDYSGSTDFLTPLTGYPIPCTLRHVLSNEYPWSSGQSWAEPDLDAAIRALREVIEFPVEARERAARARKHVLHRYDVKSVGEQMGLRFDTLRRAGAFGT